MTAHPGPVSRSDDSPRLARRSVGVRQESAPTIGPWQLTALLHRGRRLKAYRARPATSDVGAGYYVLKTAPADGDQRLAAALLYREAAVADSVQQANLVSVLAAHPCGPAPYIVLPLLDGLTVDALLASSSRLRLPVCYALWIARQIAQALSALHASGWLHGQVRPEHVLVSSQGHATLLDLSQCRRLETDEAHTHGLAPESPVYAAPELFLSQARLTPASDQYCLGLLLFELLAGRPAFAEQGAKRLAHLHREAALPEIRHIRPEVSQELALLLRDLTAKEPLRRPTSEQVVRWLAELEIAALQ